MRSLRVFLAWVKENHPEIIDEYIKMIEGAMEEIAEIKKTDSKDDGQKTMLS